MKNTERFNRAISALVKGYMKNTLAKGSCYACAVGNMIAHSLGKEVVNEDYNYSWDRQKTISTYWTMVFNTNLEGEQLIKPDAYIKYTPAKKEIDSTGYSFEELAQVELAFERNTKIVHTNYYKFAEKDPRAIDEDQLNGLMAVVDVLCKIEGIEDPKPYKEMFVKESCSEEI